MSGGPRTQLVSVMETWGYASRQRGGRGHLRGVETAEPKVLWEMGPVYAAERRPPSLGRGPEEELWQACWSCRMNGNGEQQGRTCGMS